MVDGLGRLVRVDEPNSSGSLGTTSSPNQATSYLYNNAGEFDGSGSRLADAHVQL